MCIGKHKIVESYLWEICTCKQENKLKRRKVTALMLVHVTCEGFGWSYTYAELSLLTDGSARSLISKDSVKGKWSPCVLIFFLFRFCLSDKLDQAINMYLRPL